MLLHLDSLHFAYAFPAALAALLSAFMALVVGLQRRRTPGNAAFVMFLVAITVWSFWYALEMVAVSLDTKILTARLQYLGIVSAPIFWLIFVTQYAGLDRWLPRYGLVLLFIVPVVTLVMVWTNDWHHLHWTSTYLDKTIGYIPIFKADKGPWFWLHTAYSYLAVLSGSVLLARIIIRSSGLYRWQAVSLLAAVLAPWAGNVLYLSRANLLPGLDLTVVGFSISGLCILWGLFQLRLLDLALVARSQVLDNLNDAVIVFDSHSRVIDINLAAAHLLRVPVHEAVGQPAEQICLDPHLLEQHRDTAEGQFEVTAELGETTRHFDMRISPLQGARSRTRGRIVVLHDITAHKELAQSLRESEERYRTLFEATNEAVALTDQGRILEVNQTFERIFGYTRQEAIGLTAEDLVHPDHVKDVMRRIRSGDEQLYETVVQRKDGSSLSVDVSGQAITYQGRTARVVAIRDLTEQKRAQEAEHKQHALAEALRDTAAALNSTLLLDDVLDRILDNVGRVIPHDATNIMLLEGDRARVVRARTHTDRVSSQDVEKLVFSLSDTANLHRMVDTGEPVVMTNVHKSPDWKYIDQATDWIGSYAGAPIRADGETIGFLNLDSATPGFFTQEHLEGLRAFADQAAVAIRNARLYGESQKRSQRLALLNDITRIGTAMLNLDDLLQTLANWAARIVDGDACYIDLWDAERKRVTPAAASGSLHEDYRNLEIRPGEQTLTQSCMALERPLAVEDVLDTPYITRRIAEHFHTCSLLAIPLHADGRALGALLLGFAVRHAFGNEEIDWAVQAAELIALAMAKSQTYAELEARNRELDAFNHTVAHDLRSPLSSIVGSLELIADEDSGRLSELGEEMLTFARRAALKMNQIIDALLMLARVRSSDVAIEPVSMRPVVEAAVERFRHEIGERGVKVDIAPELPAVLGVGPWLEEVFANLIGNAIKYMDPDNSAPRIIIRASRYAAEANGGGCVCYEVQDNGLGIKPDDQQRLFQMFVRLHPGHAKGVGLGLSIVERVISRLGGEIGVNSTLGEGSTFWFKLPAPQPEIDPVS